MINLRLALVGKLDEYYQAQRIYGAQAVKRAVRRAGTGFKNEMRRQVIKAGLDKNAKPGRSVAKSWQDKVYPLKGASFSSAALVYSKFPKAMQAFEKGALITASNSKWLAIPTPEVGSLGNKRLTAKMMVSRFQLRFVLTRDSKVALLIGKKSGKDVVYFYLYRQVRIRKRINMAEASEKWLDKLPGYIIAEWEKAERKTSDKAQRLLEV